MLRDVNEIGRRQSKVYPTNVLQINEKIYIKKYFENRMHNRPVDSRNYLIRIFTVSEIETLTQHLTHKRTA